MAFRTRTAEALIGGLAELAASARRTARYEAARSLEVASGALPLDVVLVQCLALTRDPAVEVRGAAARSLAALAPDDENALAAASWQRLIELLEDPGAIVAGWVLGGLRRSSRGMWPAEVDSAVSAIAATHLSHRVRTEANRVLTSLSTSVK
jgi:hypothetical protein